eukprot:GILJ01008232.1.p1 GENE.GILJ01008232.1~~GILJ01008232.1.p1  ORF type:complete len:550 (-),score=76.95 GILJ01008232.1:140-1789(-)
MEVETSMLNFPAPFPSAEEMRSQLRKAVQELSCRGLMHAAKWAAELCVGLPKPENPSHTVYATSSETLAIDDNVALAKAYFDLREYQRAASVLAEASASSSLGLFLRCYSLYLAGEKRKEEEILEQADPLEKSQVVNRELKSLCASLAPLHEKNSLDGFGLYIYGVVLKEMESKDKARAVFVQSVNAYPWNWSAWLDLTFLCSDRSKIDELKLNRHWMQNLFVANAYIEMQLNKEACKFYEEMNSVFPTSTHVLAQTAIAHYNLREFDDSKEVFESIRKLDPYRLENMDTFSNILYVEESGADLSYLAHDAVRIDKYRPETCCIIGNYYSLKSEHEKAVVYFRRALKLNRNFLSAWTLMGHEYVEMKNTKAAIEAYRRAVDINPRDYRAWYGLGQTYEVLQLPYYALYYYRNATTLRPYDARMWCAMAGCYEVLHRVQEVIRCYERADQTNDREGIAVGKLARLYRDGQEDDKAAHYFTLNLNRRDAEEMEGPETVEALLFLGNYYKNKGDFALCEQYCSRLLDHHGPAKEEASAILREIRSVQSMPTF